MPQPLPGRIRRGYALGAVATGTFGTVPGLLLLPYLTDTLDVAAGVAGLLVFLPKVWDVLLNPVAGRISDRSTHPGGRRRPFLLRAGILLAVTFALIFAGPAAPPWLAGGWVVLAFLACASAYAFFQVPYMAMSAEITLDYAERTRLMTWKVAVLAVAILLSGATAPMVVDAVGDQTSEIVGYRAMGVYVGLILLVGALGAYLGTRGAPALGARDVAADRLRDQLSLVAHNADFRNLLLTFMLQALGTGTLLAGVAYVADDVFEQASTATFLFAAFIGPALIVTPLWERYAVRRGKRQGYVVATLCLAAGTGALVVSLADLAALTYVAAGLAGIGYAGAQVFPMAMIPDVAAEDAARTGTNRVGVFNGVWTAGETLGLALGPGVFALVLAVGGYVSTGAGEDAVQPGSAVTAIGLGFSIVPAALIAVSLLSLRRYRLDTRLVPPTDHPSLDQEPTT